MNSPDASDTRARWQASPQANWLALLLGALPLYALAIYGGASGGGEETIAQFADARVVLLTVVGELLVFGGLMLACLWFISGQRTRELNTEGGTILTDIAMGFGAFAVLFACIIGFGLLARLGGIETVPDQNIQLGRMLAADPLLIAVFLGPVIWLKAALLEEFSRVFMLSRLWRIFATPTARFVCLCAVSTVFGLGHLWQGWYAVAGTALIGQVLGLVYMKTGRVLPLIIAHGLYDTMVMLILIAIGSGQIPLPAA